jgi:endo-1,4-beta-xylanase
MRINPFVPALAATLMLASHLPAQPALKDAFNDDFLIGAALNPGQFTGSNPREADLVKQQFNSTTPENCLKWESVHPAPGRYDFTLPDQYVAFGETNHMFIIGHTLVWHNQTPDWVFQDDQGQPLTRDALLARMHDHITTVVGRYRGRIKGWDVVNEALNEDGTLRESQWRKIIGPDFILRAFQYAHAADPAAELYYNEYSLENPDKRAGAVRLIQELQAQGVKITAIGLQGHYGLDWPTLDQVNETISTFARLGLKVSITELDINVLPAASRNHTADVTLKYQADQKLNPWPNGLPDAMQQKLAARYAALFTVFMQHRQDMERVTFWGVTDANSWLNDWPIHGRTNYPLLFDRAGQPKPAFVAVLSTAQPKP